MKQPPSPNQRDMVRGRAKLDQIRGGLLDAMRVVDPEAYLKTTALLVPATPQPPPMAPCQWHIIRTFALYSFQDLYTEAWERREFGAAEDADWAAKLGLQPAPAAGQPPPGLRSPPRCPRQVERACKAVCIGPVFTVLVLFWFAWIVGKWLITTRSGRIIAWFVSMVALHWMMTPWEGGKP
ncbi:MAG: hypothetical protein IT469_01815 [Pseudomonadales bacterium]|nr:hypothetical protein [Pseudomonadales bacterium]